MQKFKLILALFVFLTTSVYSKTLDTILVMKSDTNKNWYTGRVISYKKFKIYSFITPTILVGYGFAAIYDHGILKELDVSTKNELQEDLPNFVAKIDDYLQFAPAAAVFTLNLSGVKSKHNLFDASMLYITSAAIMGVSTHYLKQGVGRTRPNGNGANSFPSGHTASAFVSAEFFYQEYKDLNPWLSYSGYLVASFTGTLRMYSNKHWFSDVVAGAGIGMASAKIAYLVYPQIKKVLRPKKASNFTLMPTYIQGTKGLLLSGRF